MSHIITKVPLRAVDQFPFRELGIGQALKISNPELWDIAKRKAYSYQSSHSGFRFVITKEWETKIDGDKFVPVPYLQIARARNEPYKKVR